MTEYYLIPTLWCGSKSIRAIPDHTDWIRRINTSHQKVKEAVEEYERELNNGESFSLDKTVRGASMHNVLYAPYSQARDYTSFWNWPCNTDR